MDNFYTLTMYKTKVPEIYSLGILGNFNKSDVIHSIPDNLKGLL